MELKRGKESKMAEKITIEETVLEGLKLIRPFYAPDERGFFMKTFEKSIFDEQGIHLQNVEDMMSFSKRGVLRGLHFQTKNPQDKLIRVYCGEIYDVVVDLRKDSSTFGCWQGFYLSEKNRLGLYIPRGFAHGHLTLSETSLLSYRCGESYISEADTGIVWNDEELKITWPIDKTEKLIISDRDRQLQSYSQFKENIGFL